jgi:hypothetical protein
MNDHTNRPPTWLERESVVPLAKVEKITSLDRDTLKRKYPDRVVQLSDRRQGMKLKPASAIAEMEKPPTVSGGFSVSVSWSGFRGPWTGKGKALRKGLSPTASGRWRSTQWLL